MTIDEWEDLAADLAAGMRYGKMIVDNGKVQMDMKGAEKAVIGKQMVVEMKNLSTNIEHRLARTGR